MYEVIEDRGREGKHVKLYGTLKECRDWMRKNTELSVTGTYVPVEWDNFNANWEYTIRRGL